MKEGEQESAADVERLNDARHADAPAASQAKHERQDG
jgi:hypothetical protein